MHPSFLAIVDGPSAVLLLLPLIFIPFAFWLWMLIDCLKHEKSEGNDKLIWVLVIIFGHWLGALVYFFVRRAERLKSSGRLS